MSVALIKWVLTRLLPGVLLCTLLAGGGWVLRHSGYQAGFTAAKSAGDAALAREKTARAGERQRVSEATAAALLKARQDEQAWRARADVLAARLAEKNGERERNRLRLVTRISKAVNDDNQTSGCGYHGLGPRGLQLYESALGYGDGHSRTGH